VAAPGALARPTEVRRLTAPGKEHNGVRLHLDFDVLRGVPVGAEVTTARASETARLGKRLAPGRLYVLDRGFADYGFFQAVIDVGGPSPAERRLRGS
jgi:hypothetical protein